MPLRPRQSAIIVLALLTSLLHFGAAFDRRLFPEGPDLLFTLNALGYLGLLGAYLLPIGILRQRHEFVWWVFVVYTVITILAWLVIWVGFNVIRDGKPFFDLDSLYGVPAKLAEILLLLLLHRDKP